MILCIWSTQRCAFGVEDGAGQRNTCKREAVSAAVQGCSQQNQRPAGQIADTKPHSSSKVLRDYVLENETGRQNDWMCYALNAKTLTLVYTLVLKGVCVRACVCVCGEEYNSSRQLLIKKCLSVFNSGWDLCFRNVYIRAYWYQTL